MLQAERLIKQKVTKGRRGSKPGSKKLMRSKRVGAKYKEQLHKNKQTADWRDRGGSGETSQRGADHSWRENQKEELWQYKKYKLQIQNQSTRNKEEKEQKSTPRHKK